MMKTFISIILLTILCSCDYTGALESVCNGNRRDVSGFAGRYTWDLGTGSPANITIKRIQRGVYSMQADGEELFSYTTCKIGGVTLAESFLEADDESPDMYTLHRLEVSRQNTVIRTLQFEEKTLQDNGISYEKEEAEVEGVPLSIILIHNAQVDKEDLVKMSVDSNGKEPFYIELKK